MTTAGISGGTMERPALQRLLADIEAGRIDVIVVYKVDRLTRALSDFAKLVEIFDRRGVSFVSITQQFNTTTSMGRLTLNILLSFAQFERELIGERVRDKIAASKKKGMWMGGTVPLGYDVQGPQARRQRGRSSDRRRHLPSAIFELKSVRALRWNSTLPASGASAASGPTARNMANQRFSQARSICCCRTGPTAGRRHIRAMPIPGSMRRSLTSHYGTLCRRCSPRTAWSGQPAPTPSSQAC